ncbi:L,D-transpeptidase family protein [Erythrobacter mangrovi]|uniref:L,D-transpeptidase family protein n=1 Tax=Erythrobacter mangrovi TaxID=2739433 RepID=A0A7D4BA64_9SPHN|nr:L,D-transpeptidase family protein [Erythrobacter mangrovi]QKG71341.1 L,D-transpeptidase family protein [Erythrobacter mangrovi]
MAAIAAAWSPVAAQDTQQAWSSADVSKLKQWVAAARLDALPEPDTNALDRALVRGDADEISQQARQIALRLAKMHLKGRAGDGERRGWGIRDTDDEIALGPMLDNALSNGSLDTFFAIQRPVHPEYSALRAAYATETDGQRRTVIARNMERWRWLPRSLGQDYVLVNTARFEARLWRAGEQAGTWRIIVGKTSTPTPVFDATITGVILNPWWEIPASIVRESVGALVRRNPALAKQRGYVWSDGRYRQKPGPNNALGQMKLVMPNPYSVFMHDTPNKDLFEKEVRAFSHGCIRTGDAIGYAATLLEGVRTREEIDQIVAAGETTQLNLAKPLPLYITYFTAVENGQGGIDILDDIYRRDGRVRTLSADYSDEQRLASAGCAMQATG